ncbi:MAG TPA: formyltetrahydrofolate deformylase, partial [Solirubrobacteraceae bacterium]|nr:formyltetrahydrofolate deformylase [Solirubrobacteraceae bacterium]
MTATQSSIDGAEGRAPMSIARLLISCADREHIVAAVSGCLSDAGANILQSDQYSTDPGAGRFYMRLEFSIDAAGLAALPGRFAAVAERFGMDFSLTHSGERKRVALLVSRPEHCLLDLLWRW